LNEPNREPVYLLSPEDRNFSFPTTTTTKQDKTTKNKEYSEAILSGNIGL
jgi:hypothetical protein